MHYGYFSLLWVLIFILGFLSMKLFGFNDHCYPSFFFTLFPFIFQNIEQSTCLDSIPMISSQISVWHMGCILLMGNFFNFDLG